MAALAALFLLAAAAGEPRPEPRVADLSITLDGPRVVADLRLEDAFDERLSERIASGLPTGIVYRFELLKDRKRWYDRGLDTTLLQVVAMYNAVTHEYLVNTKLDGKLVESRTVRDLDDLRAAMTVLRDVPLFGVGGVPPRWRLLVRARAELGSRTIMGFIPVDIATPWTESRKFWPPAEEPQGP